MKKKRIGAMLAVLLLLTVMPASAYGGVRAAEESQLDTTPVIMSEEEARLRRKVVDKMYEMALVEWTATEALVYSSSSSDGAYIRYPSGRKMRGLPYTHNGGSVNRLLYCLNENGEVADWVETKGYDGFDIYMGSDCSAALQRAWLSVSTTLGPFYNTIHQQPWAEEGALPVGDYRWSSSEVSSAHYSATETAYNGEQTMYEAYAQLRMGDGLTMRGTTDGHTRMATGNAVVYRYPDGSIDPVRSYVLITQCGGVKLHEDKDGFLTIWGVDERFSFSSLYRDGYLPITCLELRDGKAENVSVKLENSPGEDAKYVLCTGTVSSNYAIDYVKIEVVNPEGKIWNAVRFPGLDAYASYESTVAMRSPWYELELSEFASALRELHLTPGEEYLCSISVRLMNDDEFILKEFIVH